MIIDPASSVSGIFAGAYTKPPMLYVQTMLAHKDRVFAHHSVAVAARAIKNAQDVGMSADYVHAIGVAGLLHETTVLVGAPSNLDERLAREHIQDQRRFITTTLDTDENVIVNMISAMHRYTGRDPRSAYERRVAGRDTERRCIDPAILDAGQILAANCIYASLLDKSPSVNPVEFWARYKGEEKYGSLLVERLAKSA